MGQNEAQLSKKCQTRVVALVPKRTICTPHVNLAIPYEQRCSEHVRYFPHTSIFFYDRKKKRNKFKVASWIIASQIVELSQLVHLVQ